MAKIKSQESVVQGSSSSSSANETLPVSPIFRSRSQPKNAKKSMSKKAGLVFSTINILKKLKRERYAPKIQKGSSIYLTAVLEYLCAEVLELAGEAAVQNKKKRITPRHLQLAIRTDIELVQLFEHVVIPQGGVVPHIHPKLLPLKTRARINKSVKTSTPAKNGPEPIETDDDE